MTLTDLVDERPRMLPDEVILKALPNTTLL